MMKLDKAIRKLFKAKKAPKHAFAVFATAVLLRDYYESTGDHQSIYENMDIPFDQFITAMDYLVDKGYMR